MKLQNEVGALQSRMSEQGRNYELSKKSEEVNSCVLSSNLCGTKSKLASG